MPHFVHVNCRHLDNYGGCRCPQKQRSGVIAFLLGKRPFCILERAYPPLDGKRECPYVMPYGKPKAPPSKP